MYEPHNIPPVYKAPFSLNGIRFGITYENKVMHQDDPEADPLHLHEYLELFFCLSSDVTFLVNNQLYRVYRGDAVVSRANDLHVCIFGKKCLQEHFCLWVDADEDAPLLAFLNKPGVGPLLSFPEEVQKQLHNILFSLYRASQGEDDLLTTSYLLQLFVLLEKSQQGKKKEEKSVLPAALQSILDDIHNNFAEIRQINDLAEAYFISPATLNRWFRKYVHSSPHDYLEAQKLSHAAKLLASGATATEACMQSGFSDCSHFISRFKKKFGETPLNYKKKVQ